MTLTPLLRSGSQARLRLAASAVIEALEFRRLLDATARGDSDPAANNVAAGSAAGTAVGVTASSTDSNGRAITYSLADDAGGRFAIDPTSGVVTVADSSLLAGPLTHAIAVQASDGAGSTAADY